MAARAVGRHYRRFFRGTGLSAPQFNVMVTLAADPGQSVASLARALSMEPTTAVRAIQQLERRGFVESNGGRGRQSKRSSLTKPGVRALRLAIARWRAAHRELIAALGGQARARGVLAAVRRLERAVTAPSLQ